jgi:hypothetical protein
MPLLLESLHAFDAPSRASSSRLLLAVVRATWERAPAHASLLWRHLLSAWARDAPQLLGGDDAAAGAAADTAAASAASASASDGQALPCEDAAAAAVFQLADRLLGVGAQAGPPDGAGGSSAGGGGRGGVTEASGEGACAEELARTVLLTCRVLAACGGPALWDAVAESATVEARPSGISSSSTGSPAGAGLCAFMQSMQPGGA